MTIANDHAGGLEASLNSTFTVVQDMLAPGTPFYLAHPAGPLSLISQQVVTALGWRIRQTLVWVEDSLVPGHSDYRFRHEPVLYGYLPGGQGRRGRPDHRMLANSTRSGDLVRDPTEIRAMNGPRQRMRRFE